MCTTVPLSGHHGFIMELLFGVRQKSHQSFCEVEKTVFFTFSSRWSFISLRFSHLKGVTFYRLYEIKSVPDRKEMSQVISANANMWYLSFPTNSTISPQKFTIFAFNLFHGMLLVTNIIWIWISFEWEKISVKNHWKADRLASFKFLWDPVWLSGESTPEAPCSQIRILKFSKISLRQKSLPTWTGQEQALTSCV